MQLNICEMHTHTRHTQTDTGGVKNSLVAKRARHALHFKGDFVLFVNVLSVFLIFSSERNLFVPLKYQRM